MRIDRKKQKAIKDSKPKRDMIIPSMIFLTGFPQGFGVPCPYTMESIALVYNPAPPEEGGKALTKADKEIQVRINVGDAKGAINKTYYINGKAGETKMEEVIPLSIDDVVTVNTSRALSPMASACITYSMKIQYKEA